MTGSPELSGAGDSLKAAGQRISLAQDRTEIIRLLSAAAVAYADAHAVTVFLYDPEKQTFCGGDPALLPDPAVVEYVFQEDVPPTVPHEEGSFITVFGLRARRDRVGLLVLDVTGVADKVAQMDLQPLRALADQAAVALYGAGVVSRSVDESTLLTNILDSITNAIVTVDVNDCVTRLNRNAMAMLQIGGDAVGRRYQDVFHPEVIQPVEDLLREIREIGYAMERMVTAKAGQGVELHVAMSGTTLRDAASAPMGAIIVFRDMTASRELERLRRLDQMKSEFVANVSHEIKTPLTSIKAYTEALVDMVQDEQAKSFLKVIDEESDRLLFLINDLLNVSRIQSGKMKMHFALAPARSIIDEVLGISKVQSEKHKLILEIQEGLPELLLDKEKMKEVTINLIHNAVKYSPKGGNVWVRLRRDEGNLRLEVQDQGIGIAPEDEEKLFQAFSRVDTSLTAQIGGTGLGLVIAKAIVENHGGRIWMESKAGQGTTFFVLIPMRREIKRGEIGSELGTLADGV